MTLAIPATALAAALSGASKVVETRNTIPILAMVRLEGAGDTLSLVTTNLDVEYRQSLSASGELEPCCVDAKRLSAMASAASGDITLTADGHALKVKSGRSRWTLPLLPADDFPVMPADKLSKPMAFDPGMIVKRLLWAASTDATRYYLNGVFMNAEAGNVRYVATSGYLITVLDDATKWPKGVPDVILSPAFLKALPDIAGTLEWDERKARYTAEGIAVTGKNIEGTFPDYRRIFSGVKPSDPFTVDADELLSAVRRVRLASDAKERKLRVTRKADMLALRIEGTSGFEGDAEVPADCTDGFETGVNADYLVGMLDALDTDVVAIEQSDLTGLIVMRPATGGGFTGALMPMRI